MVGMPKFINSKAQVHDLQAGEQLARKHRVQRPSGFDFDNHIQPIHSLCPRALRAAVCECWRHDA